MSAIEHKEERFLFVVYPYFAFAAAVALAKINQILISLPKKVCKKGRNKKCSFFILYFFLVGDILLFIGVVIFRVSSPQIGIIFGIFAAHIVLLVVGIAWARVIL
jgi:hypothetical protein